ncbi:hypothetical protein GCM10027085_46110 [Spirosoma aerophilum]
MVQLKATVLPYSNGVLVSVGLLTVPVRFITSVTLLALGLLATAVVPDGGVVVVVEGGAVVVELGGVVATVPLTRNSPLTGGSPGREAIRETTKKANNRAIAAK